MITMKATFTKNSVDYTIEADDSSGDTYQSLQAFKLAVEQLSQTTATIKPPS